MDVQMALLLTGLLLTRCATCVAAAGADVTLSEEDTGRRHNMERTADRLETERLVIRRFTKADWAEIQKLAIDKESSEAGKYDHRWPTSEDGCKGMADYLSKNGCFWAVCPKNGERVIGLLSFNDIEGDGRLDLGHVFHRDFARDDLDTEALRCVIDHAFAVLDVQCIACRNAEDWAVQLAPLRKLGMKLRDRPEGARKSSLQKDEDGNPIEFWGCEMEITRGEWLRRGRAHEPEHAQ